MFVNFHLSVKFLETCWMSKYDDNFLIREWNKFCTGDANFYMNSILFLGILLHLIIHSSK